MEPRADGTRAGRHHHAGSLLLAIAVAAAAVLGCEHTNVSSSSHWITCAEDYECMGAPAAVACNEGQCVNAAGEHIAWEDAPSPSAGPAAGNPSGDCAVPAEAAPVDTTSPDRVVGTGTAESCTSEAFVAAVAAGGVITFDCGPEPTTILLEETAKVVNDANARVVIDGGGLVTLSGAGQRRILYMNTCDEAQHWTTDHCQDQDHPELVVQNLTFFNGNSGGDDLGGGGAIFVRGGRFRVHNSRFFNNRCELRGPDVAGGAIAVFSQSQGLPVYITSSTFGGDFGFGNSGSNGGALGTIGVSYTVLNSTFSHNAAVGSGAEEARGGGNGGAIYNDGTTFTLSLCGTLVEENRANEGGGAILFVSNDRTGSLVIEDSTLRHNVSGEFESAGYPGIYVEAAGDPQITNSTLE